MKKKDNKEQVVKTTGHEWDGIQEYDNPDPFWLRLGFYIALFFALGYWICYPSWVGQHEHGILDWSASKEVQRGLEEVKALQKPYLDLFNKSSFKEIMQDPDLLHFAKVGGTFHFANNCAVCHGQGGGGNVGYPNLTAGAWLWGGKVEDIYTTLLYGIRSGHDETRNSIMAAFGKDNILNVAEINLLVDHVIGLYEKKPTNPQAVKLFQEHCAACHGKEGQGLYEFGAPALNDAIWLYGGDRETVFNTIYNGRGGVMPFWTNKLDDATIRQLAIYVHQLGGGEASAEK